jgi:hypothetical protein
LRCYGGLRTAGIIHRHRCCSLALRL